jgi:hypothetical protein
MVRSLAVHPGMATLTVCLPNGWSSHLASPTTGTNKESVNNSLMYIEYNHFSFIWLQYSCFVCIRTLHHDLLAVRMETLVRNLKNISENMYRSE